MRTASLSLAAVVLAATLSLASAQTPTPTATPGPGTASEQHHRPKKAGADPTGKPTLVASPSPAAEASPSPAKMTRAQKKASKTPAPAATPAGTVAPGGGNGMVWVNTKSHKYHKEGSRYYGRTREGKYLSEQDAIAEGDHESTRRKASATPSPTPQ